MMYPITSNIFIQTDQIISVTVSTKVILMADGTTHTASTDAQVSDVIRCVNENHG